MSADPETSATTPKLPQRFVPRGTAPASPDGSQTIGTPQLHHDHHASQPCFVTCPHHPYQVRKRQAAFFRSAIADADSDVPAPEAGTEREG